MPKVNREIVQQSIASGYFAGLGHLYILSAKSKQILYLAIFVSLISYCLNKAYKGMKHRRAMSECLTKILEV